MTLIKNFPEFSTEKVNNFMLAKLFILECMQWVFKVFCVYYLFNHVNYGVIEYVFHLWWQHKPKFHVILFILFTFLLSHYTFFTVVKQVLVQSDSLSSSYRHFTRKQIKNAPGKIIKHNKHFNVSSRNSF